MDLRSPVAAGWDCHVHVFDAAEPVRAGHYQPVHRPLTDIEALAADHGIGHLILVQPSVYGTDNRVLLQALQASPGRHRGVVVIMADVSDAELDAMHAAGVRGVRFNLVSPVGNGVDERVMFEALAPRLRERGWHVQWYVKPDHLARVAALHARTQLPCVLDHLAGLHAGMAADHAAWRPLAQLADGGAWIKLSGWYRLQAQAPYDALDAHIARAAGLFDQRMLWASDWPHTSFAADALPGYASLQQPFRRSLSATQQEHALQTAPARLYK